MTHGIGEVREHRSFMVTVYSFQPYVNFHNTRSAAVLRPNKFNALYAIGQTLTQTHTHTRGRIRKKRFERTYFCTVFGICGLCVCFGNPHSKSNSMLTGYHTHTMNDQKK